MNRTSALLPEGFEALEYFIESWAIDGANNRLNARLDSEESDRVAFFNTAKGLVPAALELLDRNHWTSLTKRKPG